MTNEQILFTAVSQLAQQTIHFTDIDLEQPYSWRKHDEGIRATLLGTYHELRELAITLSQERLANGLPQTAVQQLLAQNHAGYRDLQAVLLGVSDAQFDQEPSLGEWPLCTILTHILGSQRWFFTLAYYGLTAFQTDQTAPSLPEDAVDQLFEPYAEFKQLAQNGRIHDLLTYYDKMHFRSWAEFAHISNAALAAPSPIWWEEETYPIQYRLHRFDAHLQQHLIHIEKTLISLDQLPNESKRLLRLIYKALAEVEGNLIGAAHIGLEARQALAHVITTRATEIAEIVKLVHELETAVKTNDSETIQFILQANPTLANALDSNGLPLVLTALYYQKFPIAQQLVEQGAHLSIHSAAAYGDLATVQEYVAEWNGWLNEIASDGFTPLQLACFFNREDVSLWLIEQGAEVTAVSQNGQRIQPIHAACAANNITIVRALLEHGADVKAKQANDFTPLHTAADNNSPELATLLLEHGANKTAVTTDGKTPYDWANEKGNKDILALLRNVD